MSLSNELDHAHAHGPAGMDDETMRDWEAEPIHLPPAQKKGVEKQLSMQLLAFRDWVNAKMKALKALTKSGFYLELLVNTLKLEGVKPWLPVLTEGLDGFVAFATSWLNAWLPSWGAAYQFSVTMGVHGHYHLPFSVQPTPKPIYLPALGMLMWGLSSNVLINGMPAAKQSSQGLQLCGGFTPFTAVHTGSASVFFGGGRAARTFSGVKGCEPLDPPPSALDEWLKQLPPLQPLLTRIKTRWPAFIERVTRAHALVSNILDTLKRVGKVWEPVSDLLGLYNTTVEAEKASTGPEKEALTFKKEQLKSDLVSKYLDALLEYAIKQYKGFWKAAREGKLTQLLRTWTWHPRLFKLLKFLPGPWRLAWLIRALKAARWLEQVASLIVADTAKVLVEPLIVANTSPNVWVGGLNVPPNAVLLEKWMAPVMRLFPLSTTPSEAT
ncbi:MAG: PAAR domain-containing protein [Myxococcota bacterium]